MSRHHYLSGRATNSSTIMDDVVHMEVEMLALSEVGCTQLPEIRDFSHIFHFRLT